MLLILIWYVISSSVETFPCTPDDPDDNGYTSVHAVCEAELVQYSLLVLKNHAQAKTNDIKTLISLFC